MGFRSLVLILMFISNLAFSQGRKPAVEDFVGIEVEQPETPAGSGSLYNLEQDMDKVQHSTEVTQKKQLANLIKPAPETGTGITAVLAVFLILGLPLLSWLFVMNHLRNKASQESATNIEVLENYRKEKERQLSKRSKDDIKKAS